MHAVKPLIPATAYQELFTSQKACLTQMVRITRISLRILYTLPFPLAQEVVLNGYAITSMGFYEDFRLEDFLKLSFAQRKLVYNTCSTVIAMRAAGLPFVHLFKPSRCDIFIKKAWAVITLLQKIPIQTAQEKLKLTLLKRATEAVRLLKIIPLDELMKLEVYDLKSILQNLDTFIAIYRIKRKTSQSFHLMMSRLSPIYEKSVRTTHSPPPRLTPSPYTAEELQNKKRA